MGKPGGYQGDLNIEMIKQFGQQADGWILNGATEGNYTTDELKARKKKEKELKAREKAIEAREKAFEEMVKIFDKDLVKPFKDKVKASAVINDISTTISVNINKIKDDLAQQSKNGRKYLRPASERYKQLRGYEITLNQPNMDVSPEYK